MRKNRIHITLSIFLLALMLVGRVGIHLFHHHDSSSASKINSSLVISQHSDELDCPLCKLEAFQEIIISSAAVFVFLLVFGETIFQFLFSALVPLSFFKDSRGPPLGYFLN